MLPEFFLVMVLLSPLGQQQEVIILQKEPTSQGCMAKAEKLQSTKQIKFGCFTSYTDII